MRNTVSLFSLVFFFLIPQFSLATNYQEDDILYVVAENGLNLREKSFVQSEIVKKLIKGEAVKILRTFQFELNPDVIEGLSGSWVLVESMEDHKKGYVFDAFISQFPVMGLLNTYSYENPNLALLPYYLRDYTLRAFPAYEKSISFVSGVGSWDYHKLDIYELVKGYKLIQHTGLEKSGFEFEVDNIRKSELYFFLYHFLNPIEEARNNYDLNLFKETITDRSICQIMNNSEGCLVHVYAKEHNRVGIFFYL